MEEECDEVGEGRCVEMVKTIQVRVGSIGRRFEYGLKAWYCESL
jgi:hypothetical protein